MCRSRSPMRRQKKLLSADWMQESITERVRKPQQTHIETLYPESERALAALASFGANPHWHSQNHAGNVAVDCVHGGGTKITLGSGLWQSSHGTSSVGCSLLGNAQAVTFYT